MISNVCSELFSVATFGDKNRAKQLLKLFPGACDFANPRFNGETPLINAVSAGDIEMVRLFLDHGANTSITDASGRNALTVGVELGRTEIVKLLIKKKIEALSRTFNGQTLLSIAVTNSKVKMVQTLLELGSNPNEISVHGHIPLSIALRNNDTQIAKLLIENGALIDYRDPTSGWRPIHVAAAKGNRKLVKILLKFGANPNSKANKNETPLFLSVISNYLDVAKTIAHAGGFISDELLQVVETKCGKEISEKVQNWGFPINLFIASQSNQSSLKMFISSFGLRVKVKVQFVPTKELLSEIIQQKVKGKWKSIQKTSLIIPISMHKTEESFESTLKSWKDFIKTNGFTGHHVIAFGITSSTTQEELSGWKAKCIAAGQEMRFLFGSNNNQAEIISIIANDLVRRRKISAVNEEVANQMLTFARGIISENSPISCIDSYLLQHISEFLHLQIQPQ